MKPGLRRDRGATELRLRRDLGRTEAGLRPRPAGVAWVAMAVEVMAAARSGIWKSLCEEWVCGVVEGVAGQCPPSQWLGSA